MRPDEETQELPVPDADGGETNDVEPQADLGPWGADAVRLGVDAEPTRQRVGTGRNASPPVFPRRVTMGALGLTVKQCELRSSSYGAHCE